MAPRPNPPVAPERQQRAGWVTRFWEELTPAQRRLVAARLRRGPAPRATGMAEAQAVWDVMGLPEREALAHGRPPTPRTMVAAGAASSERRAEAETAPR